MYSISEALDYGVRRLANKKNLNSLLKRVIMNKNVEKH